MNSAMSQKLANYGQWTYRGAWALEIVAAIIGLATGIALSYRGFVANETADSMDLVLASAPFFMIAIAELTKIAIATLLFGASWIWKLSRLLRRMLLNWRWRRVRRVPVQVSVDREVEKRVEVPIEVEKVVKEILYVPVLTDDPEALRRAMGKDLPPEVADLVKVSARGNGHRPDLSDNTIEKTLEGELELGLSEPMKGAKWGSRRARTT